MEVCAFRTNRKGFPFNQFPLPCFKINSKQEGKVPPNYH